MNRNPLLKNTKFTGHMLQMQYTVKTMDIGLALAVESISYHKKINCIEQMCIV